MVLSILYFHVHVLGSGVEFVDNIFIIWIVCFLEMRREQCKLVPNSDWEELERGKENDKSQDRGGKAAYCKC